MLRGNIECPWQCILCIYSYNIYVYTHEIPKIQFLYIYMYIYIYTHMFPGITFELLTLLIYIFMLKSILSAWPATTHQRRRKAWGSYDNKRRKNVSCRKISSQNGALMSLIWPVELDQFIRCGTHIFAGYAAMHNYAYALWLHMQSKTCNRVYIHIIYIYIHGQINRPVSQCQGVMDLWLRIQN